MTTTITASNSEATTVGAAAELRHHGVREGPAAELRLGRLGLPPLGLLALSLVLRHLLSGVLRPRALVVPRSGLIPPRVRRARLLFFLRRVVQLAGLLKKPSMHVANCRALNSPLLLEAMPLYAPLIPGCGCADGVLLRRWFPMGRVG